MVGGRLTARVVTNRTATTNTASPASTGVGGLTTLLGVHIATMTYSAVVISAFTPLVVGVLFIAFAARRGRRGRH